jgi:ABC-type arginine/histidine transport system permease subunit
VTAMSSDLGTAIWGTIVLWATSGALACLLGVFMTGGSLSAHRQLRLLARAAVNLTRGVPTSLFVVSAGILMIRLPTASQVPGLFPGTPAGFQHVALGVMVALALGSAGHLAEIFRTARASLGRARLEQARAFGLSRLGRAALLARESAAVALPATGTRLVHHLHNTAFAALFPVTELFGFVQQQASTTFRVAHFALVGVAVYVVLSGLIWLFFRVLEASLLHRVVRPTNARPLLPRPSTTGS